MTVAEIHPAAGAVTVESVGYVDLLLEVPLQREIEEGAAVGGELHRGREAALHDRAHRDDERVLERPRPSRA